MNIAGYVTHSFLKYSFSDCAIRCFITNGKARSISPLYGLTRLLSQPDNYNTIICNITKGAL